MPCAECHWTRSEDLIAKIAFAVLLVVSLSPSVVAIPAMVDYPNHLARMYILRERLERPRG